MDRRARKALISLLLPAALVPAIAGCGGGSSTAAPTVRSASTTSAATTTRAPTGTTAPTRQAAPQQSDASFVARADAVCRGINAEISSVKAKSSSVAEVKRFVPRNAALERAGVARLEQLTPPAPLKDAWQSILGYRRALATELGALLREARENDQPEMKAVIASKKQVHTNLDKVATANGFKECGKVGSVG